MFEVADLKRQADGALESGRWLCTWHLKKYHKIDDPDLVTPDIVPDEEVVIRKNLLMFGGVSCLWECLIGNGTTAAGANLTFFNNANAAVGVGDSTVAAAATQTDLQAATNKTRVAMNASFPQHTDGTVAASNTITFQSSFGSAVANFSWNETAVFNSATAATGRMLNRLVQSFGTKSSGTWAMTVQITIS
jgi:hypothetical protein